jgi:hypothetical protein
MARGLKIWLLNGSYHRVDGPAVVTSLGHKSWYLYGQFVSKKDFDSVEMVKRMQAENLFTIKELAQIKLDT